MWKCGGIGADTTTPVRCSTGPARLAFLMTLALLRLRLPGGGVPLRRERPLAASTGRARGTRVPLAAGGRGRTSPRLQLRPRRRGAPAGAPGRRRRNLLARTFAPWTRNVRGTQLLVLWQWLPRVDQLRRGIGPDSPRSSTRPRPSCPHRRRPTEIPGRGRPRQGWLVRASVRRRCTRCPTLACPRTRSSGGRGFSRGRPLTPTRLSGLSRTGVGRKRVGRWSTSGSARLPPSRSSGLVGASAGSSLRGSWPSSTSSCTTSAAAPCRSCPLPYGDGWAGRVHPDGRRA